MPSLLHSWKFIARISDILLGVVEKCVNVQFDFGNFTYSYWTSLEKMISWKMGNCGKLCT